MTIFSWDERNGYCISFLPSTSTAAHQPCRREKIIGFTSASQMSIWVIAGNASIPDPRILIELL